MAAVWIGLLGTLVGAAASTVAQLLLSNLSRKRQLADARVDAAAALVSAAQGIGTEYRMLAWALDQKKPETAELMFKRGLDAWKDFQHARALVSIVNTAEVNAAGQRVYEALDAWVDNLDEYYMGNRTGEGHHNQSENAKKAIRDLAIVAAAEPSRPLKARRTPEKRERLSRNARSLS